MREDARRVRFGPFVLDIGQRRLTRDGSEVHLTPMAFNLLALLVEEAPRVVPKQELHERLWPRTFVSEATLLGLVKELRRALDDREARTTIRTVNRIGYAFGGFARRENPARVADSHVTDGRTTDSRAAHGRGTDGRAGHWLLVNGRHIGLKPGTNIIGRDPDVAIWLNSSNVSRRHAQIVVDGDGVRLEDLGSKNGTIVGEQPLDAPCVLRDGDRFTIGGLTLTYRSASSGATTDTEIN